MPEIRLFMGDLPMLLTPEHAEEHIKSILTDAGFDFNKPMTIIEHPLDPWTVTYKQEDE